MSTLTVPRIKQQLMVIDLNPRVKAIIERALQEAKPVWLGITDRTGSELAARRALWMNEVEPGVFENGNQVSWECNRKTLLLGALLAETAVSAPFCTGQLQTPREVRPHDTLMVLAGAICFKGKLPSG